MSRDIITIFLTSLTPVLELRGGMVLAWGLQVPLPFAMAVCITGSTLLGIITYTFGEIFVTILRKILPFYMESVERKKEKLLKNYEKWGYIALTLFIGIPLPGTGAFTGALLAGLLELKPIPTFIAIVAGNTVAATILSLLFLIKRGG